MVKANKYYSIILDCTPDKNRIEQMSLTIRFVTISNEKYEIREHLVGFTIVNTTGESLKNIILDELNNLEIPISI